MRTFALALAIVTLGIFPSVGASEERHSGTVVSCDPGAGTIVLGELTASPSETPTALLRTITVAPGARLMVLSRSNEPQATVWPGGFVASPISLAEIRQGDFVTVVGQERDGRLVASGLEVSREEPSPSASPRGQ